ncbi:MAG: hypothetical protein ABR581_06845 [Thermoleophilaceae bacterium]
MRRRDPRRMLARRRQARARVRILEVPQSGSNPDGSLTSRQTAEVTLPRSELDRIWTPEYLERLARTYWRFLTRMSLGLLRVRYTADSREVVLLGRPLVLLRFSAPEYDIRANAASVTWRIQRGLLVAPGGRGKGYLRIAVLRVAERGDEAAVWVASEVASFFPMIGGWGWFQRVGRPLYRITQLRIHVVVTHAFLRSLANLDLAPSVVGALARTELS